MDQETISNDMKKSLDESIETKIEIDFKNAEFDWNDFAKSFENLRFTVIGKDDFEIDDFDAWLQRNFPKEYEVLTVISNKELFGTGFEYFVVDHMMTDGVTGIAGIYIGSNIPLIRFKDAKSL